MTKPLRKIIGIGEAPLGVSSAMEQIATLHPAGAFNRIGRLSKWLPESLYAMLIAESKQEGYESDSFKAELSRFQHVIKKSTPMLHFQPWRSYLYTSCLTKKKAPQIGYFNEPPYRLEKIYSYRKPLAGFDRVIIADKRNRRFFQSVLPDSAIHFIALAADEPLKSIDYRCRRKICFPKLDTPDREFAQSVIETASAHFKSHAFEAIEPNKEESMRLADAAALLLPYFDMPQLGLVTRAMAMGIPILALDTPSTRQMLNGKVASLARLDRGETRARMEFMEAVEAVIEGFDEVEEKIKAAKRKAANVHHVNRVAKQWAKLFDELAG